MPKAHETEWIAHVYYPDGEVKEVSVYALAGHKFSALGKVYNLVEVTGPNDPKILGVKIQETGKTKAYKAGKKLKKDVIEGAEEGDLETFKRYRVSLFPTHHSAHSRVQVLRAQTPFDALTSVMALCKVDDVQKTGPYIVEEADGANGWMMKMAKKASAFGHNYVPPVPHGPNPPATQNRQPQTKKDLLVSSVAELFRMEKKVNPPQYNVKQD